MSEPGSSGRETEVQVGVADGDGGAEARVEIPDVLPVLPLKNTVLFPFLLSPLLVNTARSKRLIDAVLVTPERLLVAPAVRRPVEGSPGPDDVHRVATVLRIVKMLKFPDESYRLLVQGVARARIEDFVETEPFLRGRVQRIDDSGDPESVEITALQRNVAQLFGALVAESPRLSDELAVLAANLDDPGRLADLVASNLDLDVAQKQVVLETPDVEARLRGVLEELTRSREALNIETEIRDKVQSEIGKTQRDYVLRQQLDAIRKELGETPTRAPKSIGCATASRPPACPRTPSSRRVASSIGSATHRRRRPSTA